jgi:outer membrane protein assembly factor BamA
MAPRSGPAARLATIARAPLGRRPVIAFRAVILRLCAGILVRIAKHRASILACATILLALLGAGPVQAQQGRPAPPPAPAADPAPPPADPAPPPAVRPTEAGAEPPAEPASPEPQLPAPPPAEPPPPATPPAGSAPGDESALKYVLEDIEVRGNTKTRSRVVIRYVPFRPGDVIDADDPQLVLTRYRLLGTGFFREVELSLRKGKRRGHVVLIVEVTERNTLVVNEVWMGLSADADTRGQNRPLTAYAGVDVAETNLAGTGITLGGALALAQAGTALRLRFFDPAFLGSRWMTNGTLVYNDGSDFFGNSSVLVSEQPPGEPYRSAVVQYKRFGGSLGVGRDLSVSTQLFTHYRLESVNADVPGAASHVRGKDEQRDREPIDFSIVKGQSLLSTIGATLQHDTRDKPILTTQGWFTSVTAEASLTPLGSDYAYGRVDVLASHWWTLPASHVLRLKLFGGAIFGRAPFFERYYVGDLSDFRAARVLGLNVERRPAPNFFGTDVVEVHYGDYAAKFDAEYRIPLYRGHRSVFGIDLFVRAGVFLIAGQRDIVRPPGGYSGAALLPIDFTSNLGVQMDTSAGGFTFALANVLGFIPALSEEK